MDVKLCSLALLVLLVGLAAAYEEEEWTHHAKKNKLKFKHDKEQRHRKKHFHEADDMIHAHNKKNRTRYRLGHNKFSTMSDEEKKKHKGLIIPQPQPFYDDSAFYSAYSFSTAENSQNLEDLPSAVDYRNHTCMQRVKYQGGCSSCWIFAATAVLEFENCMKTGKPVRLSEQQIVDCVGFDGCEGGYTPNVWLYDATVGGRVSDSSYPYTAKFGSCKFDPSQVTATVSTSDPIIALKGIPATMAALAKGKLVVSPLSVPDSFFNLVDGIFDGPCNKTQDHAVVLVGYGTSTKLKTDFWIFRNSWGRSWGEDGYMKIRRGVNLCGIEQYAFTTKATSGDVPLGVPFKFEWTTSSDGFYTYSNCSYMGQTVATSFTGAQDCGLQCASTPDCETFSWWGGVCRMLPKSDRPYQITLADGRCGQVVKRPNLNFGFAIGSNGLAMYAPKCGYTGVNSKTLKWQFSDEADCGAVCAVTPSCSYFAFWYDYCFMYSIADQSIALTPLPYPTTHYPSCGYVTSRNAIVPKWQSTSNGQIMSAPNCGYIGTDPADSGIQRKSVKSLSEADCASTCAATSTCTHYRWGSNWCRLMSIVTPVVYYSTTGSCGYVVKRTPIIWQTNGQFQTSSNCIFPAGAYTNNGITNIDACASSCNKDTKCNYFNLWGGRCRLGSSTTQALAVYSDKSSCGQIASRIPAITG